MPEIALMIEGQEDLTWERWLRFVDAAETLEFDGVFRSDHLTALNGEPGRESLALWPSLTAVAMRTSRIRFGPLVAPITFHHPSLMAKNAASIDVLSEGRFDLGLGAGWFEGEHTMFGIEYPPHVDRVERLNQAAIVIKALWSGEPVSVHEGHYRLVEAQNLPRPAQKSPMIIMGGKGPRTLAIVARHAAEWNFSYSTLEVFLSKSAELDRCCEAIGRDPQTIRRSMMLPFAIGKDSVEVDRHIEAHRVTFSDLPSDQDDWVSAGFLVGSPDQIVDQIGRRVEAGVTRFMLQQNALDDMSSVELLAEEVLPQL